MKETFLFAKSKSSKVAKSKATSLIPQLSTEKLCSFDSLNKSSILQITLLLFFSLQLNVLSAQDCTSPDWNDPTNKSTLSVSATASTNGNINVLLDGNLGNNNFYYPDEGIAGLEVLRVTFPQAEILTGIEYAIGDSYMFNTNGVVKIQGSNDGSAWTDMVPVVEGTSPSLVISGNNYTKDRSLGNNHSGVISSASHTERMFWTNASQYIHYRILGVSGNTNQNPWINELFFQTTDGFEATNLGCNDNSTLENYTDDLLTFDMTPIKGIGNYTVAVDGGFTVNPTSGTYGATTSFTVSAGSSGAGDLNLTLTDSNVPCTTTIVIPNTSNACIPGACGGTDWNLPANKSTITGIWDVPGTPSGATTGSLAVLVDGNESSGFSTKSNNFSNLPFIVAEFTEATVLTGIEISCNSGNGPITGGSYIVQGSNDGTSYTDISVTFTYNTNLSAGAPVYGGGSQAYTFPFAANTDTYTHYRIFANSMNTQFGRNFYELSFNYEVFNTELANVSFGDNSTPSIFTDDVVNFDLNPSPGTGMYSVQSLGGYTITPTTGTYGQVTSFQISEGSAGTGDLTVLLIDQTVPCVQDITIPNPDLTASVVLNQAACASPTDSPLSTITLTATDGVYEKAEYNIGTVYAGAGYSSATAVTGASTGFEVANSLPNPDYPTYYTVRGYASETLYRDFVVSVEPKVCSVADLSLTVSPATETANVGEHLVYTVTLNNAGPDPAVNVEVKVDVPVGLELLSTSSTLGAYVPGTQLWSAELVPVGSHELSITYRMK